MESGADAPLVLAVQMLRLFAVIFAGSLLGRWSSSLLVPRSLYLLSPFALTAKQRMEGRVRGGELGSMNEFEHTLMSKLASKDMTLSELAERIGYEPLFLKNIVAGKDRSVPVNFFVRTAEALGLSNQEKDELVRSWPFGVERWY